MSYDESSVEVGLSTAAVGAAGGAAAGAALGPIGAAVGAAVGAVIGFFTGLFGDPAPPPRTPAEIAQINHDAAVARSRARQLLDRLSLPQYATQRFAVMSGAPDFYATLQAAAAAPPDFDPLYWIDIESVRDHVRAALADRQIYLGDAEMVARLQAFNVSNKVTIDTVRRLSPAQLAGQVIAANAKKKTALGPSARTAQSAVEQAARVGAQGLTHPTVGPLASLAALPRWQKIALGGVATVAVLGAGYGVYRAAT